MKRLTAALVLTLITLAAGCASTRQSGPPINTPAPTSLGDGMQPATAAPDTPDFALTDLQNAQAIFDASFKRTANPYDAAGSRCVATMIDHRDELQALSATPKPPPLGAPVTGLFSGIAAAQVTAEDAQARIAAKLALLRDGIPPEVHIACAYILVEPKALLKGLARKKG